MLVLSRKVGEEIRIGSDITVRVRRVHGNRVAIGIEAPNGVRILRGELRDFADAFGEACLNTTPAADDPGPKKLSRSRRCARQTA